MKDWKTRILSADYKKRFRQLIAAGICIFAIGGGTSAVLLHTVDANAFTGAQQPGNGGMTLPGNRQGQSPSDGSGMPDNGQGFSVPGNGQTQPGSGQGSMPGNNGQTSPGTNGQTQPEDNMQGFDNGMNRKGTGIDQGMNGRGTGMDQGMNRGGAHGRPFFRGGFLQRILGNSNVSIASKIAVLATTILGIIWAILTWLTIVFYVFRTSVFSGMNRVLWTVLAAVGHVFALIAFFIVRSFVKEQCQTCESWQDSGTEYCTHCGSPMRTNCPNCNTSVSKKDAYCASCGTRLKEQPEVQEKEAASDADTDAVLE